VAREANRASVEADQKVAEASQAVAEADQAVAAKRSSQADTSPLAGRTKERTATVSFAVPDSIPTFAGSPPDSLPTFGDAGEAAVGGESGPEGREAAPQQTAKGREEETVQNVQQQPFTPRAVEKQSTRERPSSRETPSGDEQPAKGPVFLVKKKTQQPKEIKGGLWSQVSTPPPSR
jgi:hypothetical protein